jgi:formylglycine-generating enzyme required for sulfatase activity
VPGGQQVETATAPPPAEDAAIAHHGHVGVARAMRGGAFVYDRDNLCGGARSNGFPSMRNHIHGFRCARPM